MNIRRLVLAVTFLAIFAMAARASLDSDSWWHLRTGQWIVDQHEIPQTDPFSFSRFGEEWHYPSAAWLSQVGMYSLYATFGPGMINLLVAGLVTLALLFVYMSLSGGIFLKSFTLILAALTSSVYWAARPYLASFLLSAVFVWVLEDFRWRRANRLVWLPLLMVAWANLHPGFAFGFTLLGVYLLAEGFGWLQDAWVGDGLQLDRQKLRDSWRERFGPLLLLAPAFVLAASLNPSGPALLRYPFETLSIGVLRDLIQEWQSPNFHLIQVQPFAWLLLLTLAAVGASGRRMALSDFLLVGVFAMMALLAGRNIAIFALAAPIVLTRYAEPAFEALRRRLGWQPFGSGQQSASLSRLNVGLLALMVLAVAVRVAQIYPPEANTHFHQMAPVGAVEFIKEEQPSGQLFNSYNWGGYLIWALPEYPVFVDGRTDLYGDETLTEFLDIAQGREGWQSRLEQWEINLVLVEPHIPLARLLPYEGWQLLYEDDLSVLYARP